MAQYLPVLLVSVSAVSSNPTPDDSSLDTQATGQVDYLSHDWQEEDVAKSWRNMTRRKDSIQNGARLENASWRTWWKQRNNLPTVSPETLNWLKDSDVTWLYGPLHTAADWAPPPRHSPESDSSVSSTNSTLRPASSLRHDVGPGSRSARSNSPWSLKPILKHRSISELLSISLPSSPGFDPMELDEEPGYFNPDSTDSAHPSKTPHAAASADDSRKRPKLTHTKSDSNVHHCNPFRRESPPLPLAARSRDSSCGDSSSGTQTTQRARHISFNTFVEQCIAIEKPKKALHDLDSFDEHEEGYRDEEEDSDEDESEDEVLEMRPTPRSRSSSSRRTPSLSGASASTWSTSAYDMSSPEREHVTIAPIAPTMLKTSASPSPVGSWSYGGLWDEDEVEDEETLFARTHHERADGVNLVYVPPQGSVYAERMAATATKISPPHVSADLRAASFDESTLLPGRRTALHTVLEPPFETSFDFFGGPDVGGSAELNPQRAGRSGRSPAQSRSPSAPDLAEVARSKSSTGSVSDEGTVVPPPPSASIPVPRVHTHPCPSSTPSPVPSGVSSSSSPFLEPPPRGRSTSPITGYDRDPPRGRSRSRGSLEGSVSPRSGSRSRLGLIGGTGLGASPTWRDTSLSPEESEGGARRASKRVKRHSGNDAGSVSPPSAACEKDDDGAPRPSVQLPSELPQDSGGDEDTVRPKNSTPSNPPTAASKHLAPPPPEEPASLAGRAADIVTSARDYLGSLWGAGERHPSYIPGASTEVPQ